MIAHEIFISLTRLLINKESSSLIVDSPRIDEDMSSLMTNYVSEKKIWWSMFHLWLRIESVVTNDRKGEKKILDGGGRGYYFLKFKKL